MPKDSYQGRSLFCPNNAFFQILYDKLDVVNLSSATPDDLHGLNHRLIIYAYSIILEFREQIAANNYQKLIAELKKIDEFLCNIYGHIQQYTFKCLPGTLKDFRRKTSPDAYWNFLFITAHLLARCKALSAGLVCKEWGAINPLIESVDFFYNNFLGMLDGHASHCDPLHPRLDASQRAQQDPDFVQHGAATGW